MQMRDQMRSGWERAPKCGAYARTTKSPCRNPKMPNGRCRMHGGTSTGRPTTTGRYTKARKAEMREIRLMLRAVKALL
jgi:hypothetical protein